METRKLWLTYKPPLVCFQWKSAVEDPVLTGSTPCGHAFLCSVDRKGLIFPWESINLSLYLHRDSDSNCGSRFLTSASRKDTLSSRSLMTRSLSWMMVREFCSCIDVKTNRRNQIIQRRERLRISTASTGTDATFLIYAKLTFLLCFTPYHT